MKWEDIDFPEGIPTELVDVAPLPPPDDAIYFIEWKFSNSVSTCSPGCVFKYGKDICYCTDKKNDCPKC